jgi:hypothetical protein
MIKNKGMPIAAFWNHMSKIVTPGILSRCHTYICPMNFEVISDCQEKHLKTFVRELQIVQPLENQLVQHYISYKSCTYLLVVYRLVLSLSYMLTSRAEKFPPDKCIYVMK